VPYQDGFYPVKTTPPSQTRESQDGQIHGRFGIFYTVYLFFFSNQQSAREFLELVSPSKMLTSTSALLDPPPLERSLGPVDSDFFEILTQNFDDFFAMVPHFPGAFMTGFRSVFEEPTSSSRPFTGPGRTRPATPQRAPKPYQRGGAPSPPSHRRRRLLPDLNPVANLAPVPRRRKAYPPTYSALLASVSTNLSPPPLFSLGRQNRTLIINPPCQY
jgi:hypothetical protein